MESIIKPREHLGLLVLVTCCQICLSCNQIALFFDHQYLGRDSINIYLRLPLLVGCGQLSFSLEWIAGFFDHQFLWKESIDILVLCVELVHGVSRQNKVAPETTPFHWLWPGQIGFQDSLILQGINLFLCLVFSILIFFFIYLFASLSNFSGVQLAMTS